MDLHGKKILFLCTTDNMIWQFYLPHIRRLEELGGIVECAAARTGFWFDELKSYGLIMHKFSFARSPFKLRNLGAYKRLKALIRANGYDIIYCHQSVGGLMGRLAGKKLGVTVVHTVHGFFFWQGCSLKNRLLFRTAERWLAKKTDALITINEEDYAAAKTMKAKRVYKVCGVGVPPALPACDLRSELGIDRSAFVVVTVSEFIPRKNYPAMLRAIALADDCVYVICGCGKDQKSIVSTAKKLGIEGRVVFAGYRKDISAILPSCDTMLHFSKQEGLPVAVIEAMQAGLPIVASDVRGTRDLLSGSDCLLPLSSPPERIAAKILELKNDPEKRMQEGSRNEEESIKYEISAVLAQHDDIFREI